MKPIWIYNPRSLGKSRRERHRGACGLVAGAKASDLPAADRERLRLHVIDTVVAARAGAHIPEGKALHSLGDDGALPIRIGRQAAAIRLTEIDDIHLPSCTTPSAGVVPVALMLAAREQ